MSEQLKAGPDLDRLVHAKVKQASGAPPPYSTDIAAAWELWKGLPRPKRLHVGEDGVHHCMCGGSQQGADGTFQPAVWEKGERMALVICLAALKQAERRQG